MWGRWKENGIWRTARSHKRLIWRNNDALYIALGHWRLRLMKPWRRNEP